MTERRAEVPLFFLHLPRTGGTSLISFLDRQFPAHRICPAHEMFEFEALRDAGTLQGYALYRGHFGINLPRLFPDPKRRITWLRNPVERVWSSWKHLRAQAPPFEDSAHLTMVNQIRGDVGLAQALEFEPFCRSILDQGRRSFFNQACVLLGLGRGWEVAARGIPTVDDALLAAAIESADALDFVGFQEHFESSLRRLCETLDWLPETTAPHLNASRTEEAPIEPSFRRWLEDVTRFDRALYDHVLARRLA